MRTPSKIIPIFLGTIIMTGLSVLPFVSIVNCLCCAGIMFGGFSGVYFYKREVIGTDIQVTARDAAFLGILIGVLSAILVTGINTLVTLFANTNPITEVTQLLDQMGTPMPPEVYEQLEKISREYVQYGYSPTLAIFSLLMNMILYPLFGAIGAILGNNLIKQKPRQENPPY